MREHLSEVYRVVGEWASDRGFCPALAAKRGRTCRHLISSRNVAPVGEAGIPLV